jgi:hypothetical protein
VEEPLTFAIKIQFLAVAILPVQEKTVALELLKAEAVAALSVIKIQ